MGSTSSLCIVGVDTHLTRINLTITGHWGLSSPRAGVLRFTEHNDLVRFYEAAKEVGILVIVRAL